ncbi:hypothetical protein H0Z60_02030 [Ectothiorhodospiraceae bacterium WFHF3C12]|nr:hypothetical protein [Ectothiorhodospiraceae bacterium WFHF3C12]
MMLNPWVRNYLVLSLAGIQVAEQACEFWRELVCSYAGDTSRQEHWLTIVDVGGDRQARRPAVGNCAASAYSHWGLDLSRLRVANSPGLHCRGRCS